MTPEEPNGYPCVVPDLLTWQDGLIYLQAARQKLYGFARLAAVRVRPSLISGFEERE